MIKRMKQQYQKEKSILKVHIESKSEAKIASENRYTDIFHLYSAENNTRYFKSYLHQLFKNNSNECYKICTARQTLKYLLLNCKHYRTEQIKLKKKAQLKNTDTILTLFIIKIDRSATLEYLNFCEACVFYDICNIFMNCKICELFATCLILILFLIF